MPENEKILKQEMLSKNIEGVHLADNHAKMIWQKNKSLIVKSMKYEDCIRKLYYILGGNECYGTIQITDIYPINLKQFKELENKHRITEQERELWWVGKQKLFAYEFDTISSFELPQLALTDLSLLKDGAFISSVNILMGLSDRAKEINSNLQTYDATKITSTLLRDDFRIMLAWLSGISRTDFNTEIIILIESKLCGVIKELTNRDQVIFNKELLNEPLRDVFENLIEKIKNSNNLDTLIAYEDVEEKISLLYD